MKTQTVHTPLTTADIFQDGFTAVAATLPHGRFEGGSRFGIDLGLLTKQLLPMSLHVGDIMAYCFRRFGYPTCGWDDHKQLCNWIISTPLPGCVLSVNANTVWTFSVILDETLTKQLHAEQQADVIAWRARFRAWALAQGVVIDDLYRKDGKLTDAERQKVWWQWGQETYGDAWTRAEEQDDAAFFDAASNRYWDEKQEETERMIAAFREIEPLPDWCGYFTQFQAGFDPVKKSGEIPTIFWQSFPETHRAVYNAAWRTLLDLLRPVGVQDWELWFCKNHKKLMKGSYFKEGKYDYTAPVSGQAGYGVNPAWVGTNDALKIEAHLTRKYGTFEQGLKMWRRQIERKPSFLQRRKMR